MKWALAALLLVPVQGGELSIAPESRPLRLIVEKTGLMSGKEHTLEFRSYRGSVVVDETNPSRSRVRLEVDAGEFALLDDWVSEKDHRKIVAFTKSGEMLDTGNHPRIEFQSEAVTRNGEGTYEVSGQLRIRGVARPVKLRLELRREGESMRAAGKARFPMSSFGLKPPSAALGLIGTKDEMELSFDLTLR